MIKKLKTIFSVIMAAVISLSLLGCSGASGNSDGGTNSGGEKPKPDDGPVIVDDCTTHVFGKWITVKLKTCTEDGLKVRTCERCGKKEETVIPAGHVTENGYDGDKLGHRKVCLYCGEVIEEGEHVFNGEECSVCGYYKQEVWNIPDHIIKIEEGRDARVLFLADTQIIDSSQMRYPDRLSEAAAKAWAPDTMYENCFKYTRDAVKKVKPDLIIILGDIIYGEFDDDGTVLQALITEMESYGVPWAPLYGNHENESEKGALWQNDMLESAPHCLFRKGTTDGNGNYSIGIRQGNKLIRMFYIIDSNFCAYASEPEANDVITSMGFTKNQVGWMYGVMDRVKEVYEKDVPSTLCFHVPTSEFAAADRKYSSVSRFYTIGSDVQKADGADDFGTKRGNLVTYPAPGYNGLTFLQILKKYSADTVFCGHYHTVNTSIVYEGIRWTLGLKSGTYDSYNSGELGGTRMDFGETGLYVNHVYFDAAMQAKMDVLRSI